MHPLKGKKCRGLDTQNERLTNEHELIWFSWINFPALGNVRLWTQNKREPEFKERKVGISNKCWALFHCHTED